MTPVSTSPLTAEGLLAGALAVEQPCPNAKCDHGTDLSTLTTCNECDGTGVTKTQHLLPITEPPQCKECGGSGKVKRWQPTYDGGRYEWPPCPTCNGSGWWTGEVSLVMECPSWHTLHHHSDRCPDCGPGTNGYRPVATAHLLQVLRVRDISDSSDRLANGFVSRWPEMPLPLVLYMGGEHEGIHISHLLPYFGEGVKWAGLVTDVAPV